ncbi:unnamed protein product, partial [Rotaria sp. Silwood1]
FAYKMLRNFPPLVLPDSVLALEGEKFFDLVNQTCGEVVKELMEVLSINTVYKLLLVENDILSIFEKKYKELENITQKACLHLNDGTIMLKPGLRLDFDRFMQALHANLTRNKNNYRYSGAVQHFAQSLYILGGRNVYEFVRINLPGAIPAIPTLEDSLGKAGAQIEEGVFRYDMLSDHQKSGGYPIAICSEDCTRVI